MARATEERKRLFARYVGDPMSETWDNASASYKRVFPTASDKTAGNQGATWMKDPIVIEEIQRVTMAAVAVTGRSKAEMIERWLKNADRLLTLAESGIKGAAAAANAAAKYDELAGKALGHLVTLTKDLTPPAPPRALGEVMNEVLAAAAMLQQLQRPLPTPAQVRLAAAEPLPVEIMPHENPNAHTDDDRINDQQGGADLPPGAPTLGELGAD